MIIPRIECLFNLVSSAALKPIMILSQTVFILQREKKYFTNLEEGICMQRKRECQVFFPTAAISWPECLLLTSAMKAPPIPDKASQ
jgi:hypothetical protein